MDMERERVREDIVSTPEKMATIWQRERKTNEHQQNVFISESERERFLLSFND